MAMRLSLAVGLCLVVLNNAEVSLPSLRGTWQGTGNSSAPPATGANATDPVEDRVPAAESASLSQPPTAPAALGNESLLDREHATDPIEDQASAAESASFSQPPPAPAALGSESLQDREHATDLIEDQASAADAASQSQPPPAPEKVGNESLQDGEHALGGVGGGACLCLFDVDRTLTGKQGVGFPKCPLNSVQRGVYDDAYGGGDLTLSNLGKHVGSTACAGCKLGIVSHGTAGGGAMKQKIRSLVSGSGYLPDRWSYPGSIDSPLVLGCGDKPSCVRGVVDWYNRQGAGIVPSQVYMFDDKRGNVESFYGTGFNARQISCSSRDSAGVGFCGGLTWEVRLSQGVSTCR